MLRALVVVGVLLPGIAFPCANSVEFHRSVIISQMVRVEALIEKGEYAEARELLGIIPRRMDSTALTARAEDLHALLVLRAPEPNKINAWMVTHFRDRLKRDKTSARFKAWLAEAQAADGNPKAALATLKELQAKDLMPDAFAFRVLATLTTGEERDAALAACKTRAKVKSICEL
jgi:hypothetical protein